MPVPGVSAPISLAADEVHVWHASLDVPAEVLASLDAVLAPDERARASRYVFDRDRDRFVVARGLLRLLLARYTGEPAASIALAAGPRGKPAVAPGFGIEFNVSHSHETAMYAVARQPVGIDIERIRPLSDALGVAARFFSPSEACALQALGGRELEESFFRCWTRKEAYLKARGDGLSVPLDSFVVSLDPDEPALVACDQDPTEVQRWTLRNLDVETGYVATVAMSSEVRSLAQRAADARIV